MTDFADHLTSRVNGTDNCIVCSKPTRSHVVLIAHDGTDMVAVESQSDADGFGTVCHSCYDDADGDADRVAQLYNERLDSILDALDVDKEQLAKNPDEVESYRYDCSACDTTVDAEDVVEHRDSHDDVAVTFTRSDLQDS